MPQDAPKTSQDAPRRPKTPQGRPKTAPRPCQDGSKTPPDAPRRLQVGPQRRAKAPKTPPDPRKTETQKRSEAQSIPDLVFRRFLGGFWSVFGWIWEGFGDDFGSLEVDFSRILGASPKPQETTRRHRKNSMPSASAASERAQRAKRAERLRCLSAYSSGFSGRFTETTEKNTTRRRNENNKTRFPFPYLDRFMLGVVLRAIGSSKFMFFHWF